MRNQMQLFLGVFLLFVGLLAALSTVFKIDFWSLCWPIGLILLGVWLIVRPRWLTPGMNFVFRPLGDTRRSGIWTVSSQEIFTFVGDVRLDFTQADIPPGETRLRVYGFVGDIRLHLPQDVGISVSSIAFLNDVKILGKKQEVFISPVEYTSEDYASAERKIRLECGFFVLDLDIGRL